MDADFPRDPAAADVCTVVPKGVHHRTERGAFVVLRGRATIEFEEDDSLLFVSRGSLCLAHGNTRWTVTETIEYLTISRSYRVRWALGSL